MVETPAPEQPEVGHPDLPGSRRVVNRPAYPAAAEQVGGQAVDRFQHGQPSEGGLDSPRRGGPGRVLVVGAAAALFSRFTGGEGGVALVLQVDGMVVVQGEPLPVVLGQFPLRVERRPVLRLLPPPWAPDAGGR